MAPRNASSKSKSTSKRQSKRDLLLSRLQNQQPRQPSHRVTKAAGKPQRRKRPAKKLIGGDLTSLSESLPTLPKPETSEQQRRRQLSLSTRNLTHKPGMKKRREVVSRTETDRFGLNLASMASSRRLKDDAGHAGTKDNLDLAKVAQQRQTAAWESLRNYISTSLET